jgi:hypothetical protein
MDEDRKIRFFVAPLLFVASLLWGVLCDSTYRSYVAQEIQSRSFPSEPITGFLVAFVSGGITIFASGFAIGTITYVVLRFGFLTVSWFRGRGPRQHESGLSDDALKILWDKLECPGQVTRAHELYVTVTFDHGVLQTTREGVHRWVVRRWNAFSINCTSVAGLILSLCIGRLIGIQISARWYIPTTVLAFAFCATAVLAWRDTMGMLAFQAKLPWQFNVPEKSSLPP